MVLCRGAEAFGEAVDTSGLDSITGLDVPLKTGLGKIWCFWWHDSFFYLSWTDLWDTREGDETSDA